MPGIMSEGSLEFCWPGWGVSRIREARSVFNVNGILPGLRTDLSYWN